MSEVEVGRAGREGEGAVKTTRVLGARSERGRTCAVREERLRDTSWVGRCWGYCDINQRGRIWVWRDFDAILRSWLSIQQVIRESLKDVLSILASSMSHSVWRRVNLRAW